MQIVNLDFAEAEEKARGMSIEALRWSLADAAEASRLADGIPGSPKAGYYADEVHVFVAEIRRRNEEG